MERLKEILFLLLLFGIAIVGMTIPTAVVPCFILLMIIGKLIDY